VSVYVDDMQVPFGRMKLCHMLADTTEELLAMADRIGVQRKWIQKAGTDREHFDIALSKRALAIKLGARLVGSRELVAIMQCKRTALAHLEPTRSRASEPARAHEFSCGGIARRGPSTTQGDLTSPRVQAIQLGRQLIARTSSVKNDGGRDQTTADEDRDRQGEVSHGDEGTAQRGLSL
jgi:hypothetical protein